jgi:subtilisin
MSRGEARDRAARPRLSWCLQQEPGAGMQIRTDWPGPPMTEWAWAGASGAGTRVCVVDSGVEPDHPLVGPLAGMFAVAQGRDGEPEVVPDTEGDTCGHGTACASVIRAVAPDCEITSLRVLGGMSGTGDALIAGLRWAVETGFDVINLSLSTSKPQFASVLREIVDDAYFSRTAIVASAHNMAVESFPWRFASVISVGSHAEPDPWRFYYNPEPPVEFYAWGVNVPVGWQGGTRTTVSGNSFATPRVAGICALIRSKHPWMTPFQIKTALHQAAANVTEGS